MSRFVLLWMYASDNIGTVSLELHGTSSGGSSAIGLDQQAITVCRINRQGAQDTGQAIALLRLPCNFSMCRAIGTVEPVSQSIVQPAVWASDAYATGPRFLQVMRMKVTSRERPRV